MQIFFIIKNGSIRVFVKISSFELYDLKKSCHARRIVPTLESSLLKVFSWTGTLITIFLPSSSHKSSIGFKTGLAIPCSTMYLPTLCAPNGCNARPCQLISVQKDCRFALGLVYTAFFFHYSFDLYQISGSIARKTSPDHNAATAVLDGWLGTTQSTIIFSLRRK